MAMGAEAARWLGPKYRSQGVKRRPGKSWMRIYCNHSDTKCTFIFCKTCKPDGDLMKCRECRGAPAPDIPDSERARRPAPKPLTWKRMRQPAKRLLDSNRLRQHQRTISPHPNAVAQQTVISTPPSMASARPRGNTQAHQRKRQHSKLPYPRLKASRQPAQK